METMGKLDYLRQYSSKETIKAYRSALKNFFETVYGKREPLEELAERYFNETRDYNVDVQNFLANIKEFAPKSVRLKLTAIKVFLMENHVELPQSFWRKLRRRIRGNRALTLDKVPSNKELKSILTHLPIHAKAFYLSLASSGMRIGEAGELKLEDVDLSHEPTRVNIRGEYTKSGNPRVSFISREATETIIEWLKVRSEYLEAAVAKSHLYKKSKDDSSLFPFTASSIRVTWNNALKDSKLKEQDSRTNRHTFHPHVLRKFFRTRLGAIIPIDVVEVLMGHEGYLTAEYRRYEIEELSKFYSQGESALLVFTEAAEVNKLREEIDERNKTLQQEIDERNKTLQTLVNGISTENLEMKAQVSELRLKNVEVSERLGKLEKMLEKLLEGNGK